MSATFLWSTVKRGTPVAGCSPKLRDTLTEGGERTLDESDIRWLDGFGCADPHAREAVDCLIEKIREHGSIVVWKEH